MVTSVSFNYASQKVGKSDYMGEVIAKGECSYCGRSSTFNQMGVQKQTDDYGLAIAVNCNACGAIMMLEKDKNKLHPRSSIEGLEDLPEDIQKYYDEALRCISADAPNGAATLFRKTIHAIAIHYDLTEVDESKKIYKMIEDLEDSGHINEKLKRSLLATKDIGNDGAHINENEPDREQALALKSLVDAVLQSTVKTDERIDFARDKHPNPHKNDE